MQFPEHFMIFPDTVHMLVRESLCRTLLRIQGPKLFFLHEGSFKKGLGQWGRSVGPGPRAHMGLGILVPWSWRPSIILIVTSICKDFEVKFIVFLAFSYLNYFLWLVIHICNIHVFKVILSLTLLNSLGLLKSRKKNVKLNFFFLYFQKKKFVNKKISIFARKFACLSLVGSPRRCWPKWPKPRASPGCKQAKY